MKRLVLFSFVLLSLMTQAQTGPGSTQPKVYQATAEKINDLVHTRLDAKFDYSKSQLNGKAWITLKPHFYPTDSLTLDAKGMDIHEVALVKNGKNSKLHYDYDGMQLQIDLGRTYKNNEQYTVFIDYTAKPDEYKGKGSAAITDAKGLYFINPRGEDKDKPTQIWTQGETEATSVWIPIIDKPNQKTTDEIYMTVPAKYVTLSNGRLVSQKKNADGTRTDYWKMDQPHAPYLFFMGVGDFAVIKDKYKNKEVSYYVEKEYAPVARRIFGKTPEMIALYSKLTGVDYPWVKYSQIVGRDYVSGAMENTTATLHQETAQQDARELTDGNRWEEVIAHELFHQWFGDYVTTESWSNLTLNESFATLGSQLWNEFHYGKDDGDAERYNSTRGYLNSHSENKNLVRFYYNDKEDMFDAVSYNKGGAILQMLRNFVGDSAFFHSLNLYLNTNKYKSAEAQQLRLAFEEVTGKDLNWFFNQWYYGSGHPLLNITYSYDQAAQQAKMVVEQTGDKVFTLPVKVDVWTDGQRKRYDIWVKEKSDTFNFPAATQPELINFDADKILVAQKTENKTLEQYLFQQKNANNYVDRREALEAAAKSPDKTGTALQILMNGTKDRFAPLRNFAVNLLDVNNMEVRKAAEPVLLSMAQNEKNKLVKAAAISKLGNLKSDKYKALFTAAISDSSYTVAGNALDALNRIDTAAAVKEALKLSSQPAKGRLESSIKAVLISRDPNAANVIKEFSDMPFGQSKFQALEGLFDFMANTTNTDEFKKGVDAIISFQGQIPDAFKEQIVPALNSALRQLQKEKMDNGLNEQAEYIESKLPKEDKKGS